MSRVLTWTATVVLASTVLAVASPGTDLARLSVGCRQAPAKPRFKASVLVDGSQRSALVNVPKAAPAGKPLPLVLTFHGAAGDGPSVESATGMTDLGERSGFISVYPDANGTYWNVTGHGDHPDDDVTFVGSLLSQLDAALCVDDSRVYATGVSNGGSFVARIGCELSDRLAAIAPVAGGYGVQPACRPRRPVSVLEIHGTEDRIVPYGGGPNGHSGVWSFLGQWGNWDSCRSDTRVWRRLAPRVLWVGEAGCSAGTTVAHIKLTGGHHAWPTTGRVRRDPEDAPFSARQAVWQFFERRLVSPIRAASNR